MRRTSLVVVTLPVAILLGFAGLLLVTVSADEDEQAAAAAGAGIVCAPADQPPGAAVAGFSGDQLANAGVIVAVGKERGVPQRGWVVAVATAMQESTLVNLDYGDRDSVGLFQQRPSQGWGTVEQIMDPRYSAGKFYDGLLAVPAWEALPVTVAAQRVQRSGFPDAYAKWEDEANAVVGSVEGIVCQPAPGGQGSSLAAPAAGALAPGATVAPTTGRITSNYGPRDGEMHYGMDIANRIGTPIVAVQDGVVISSGPASGFGLWVRVQHGGGTVTVYGHIDRSLVAVGQPVVAGEQIATLGNRGESTGPHLHFEVRLDGSRPVDPQEWLRSNGVTIAV